MAKAKGKIKLEVDSEPAKRRRKSPPKKAPAKKASGKAATKKPAKKAGSKKRAKPGTALSGGPNMPIVKIVVTRAPAKKR